MSSSVLTDRQKRERDYYNQYAQMGGKKPEEIDVSPVVKVLAGEESRPWNSYWAVYKFAIDQYKEDYKLLDFGSGPGENAYRFSKIGYQIKGFDISEKNVELSNELFSSEDKIGQFEVSSAEALPYQDNEFDIIIGVDILHHVDIEKSIQECFRVLKPGCKAYFREPVDVGILDRIRETRLVRYFAPKKTSFELHITEDERKLNANDERIIREVFPKMKKHYYFLFARFDKFYRRGSDPRPSMLEKFDYYLFKTFPFLKKLGGTVIYELEK